MIGRMIGRTMPLLRRQAESMMVDRLRITGKVRIQGQTSGSYEDKKIVRYEGPGAIATYEPHETTPTAAGHTYTVQRYKVKIPVGAAQIRIGDEVEVLEATFDPQLANRKYTVRGLLHKSMATSQRLLADEVL